jgi:hypothetical protein
MPDASGPNVIGIGVMVQPWSSEMTSPPVEMCSVAAATKSREVLLLLLLVVTKHPMANQPARLAARCHWHARRRDVRIIGLETHLTTEATTILTRLPKCMNAFFICGGEG